MPEPRQPSEQEVAIARVYAQAVLEIADARGEAADLLEELNDLVAFLSTESVFEEYLMSPLVGTAERGATLEKLLRDQMSDLLLDTMLVMNRKGRGGLVRALAVAYRKEIGELNQLVGVRVRSALPLTEELREGLREAVSSFSGRAAQFEEEIDASLLGGLVLQVGDRKIDTSLATELGAISAQLSERASREIQGGTNYLEET
jgi:F-type H+-transporting ATPase subunit delta